MVATSTLKHNNIENKIDFADGSLSHHYGDVVDILKVQTVLVGRQEVAPEVYVETDKAAHVYRVSSRVCFKVSAG